MARSPEMLEAEEFSELLREHLSGETPAARHSGRDRVGAYSLLLATLVAATLAALQAFAVYSTWPSVMETLGLVVLLAMACHFSTRLGSDRFNGVRNQVGLYSFVAGLLSLAALGTSAVWPDPIRMLLLVALVGFATRFRE